MRTNLLFATTLAGVAIAGAGVGVAGATASTTTVPRNRIARYTLREERLNAVAEVLGTNPSGLEDKLKTETMKQVVKDAGYTPETFHQKVKAQLQSDLLAQGYSQAQIDSALNRAGKHKPHSSTS